MVSGAEGDAPVDFFSLLRHPKYCPLFEEWLRQDHSFENLLFWKDVEDFKELPGDRLAGAAAAIQKKYFELGSDYEINLDHHQKLALKEKLLVPTADMFDEIQISIFLLMRLDSYPKFIESDMFREASGLPVKATDSPMSDSDIEDDGETQPPKKKGFSCFR